MVSFIFQCIQALFWITAIFGVIFTWISFRATQKLKRAEWIKSLFEKFYENSLYKPVRFWIDYKRLEHELENDNNHEKEEQLSDFLNFFEFIATLEKMKQLSWIEIKDLFEYYLRQIWNSEKCRAYIDTYEFKNLKKLLSENI